MKSFTRLAIVIATVALGVLACTEQITSPASCPDFCPSGQIVTVESLLTTAINRDSSFRGYVEAHRAFMLLAATLPGLESRPIFQTSPIAPRLPINSGGDTTTGPIVADSSRLTFTLLRRDTAAHNLRLVLYRLPLGLDSTSTFAGTAPAFAGTPVRVVNLDSLFAKPGGRDSVTGDSVLSVDSVRHAVTFSLKFDTTQLPFVAADSGQMGFGVRVTADIPTSAAFGSSEIGTGPEITWFIRVDSAGTLLQRPSQRRLARVDDGFVFDPPPAALDSNLTIGGVPSARALLRIAVPRAIRDSSQIIRATLILVPVAPIPATPADSFFLQVNHVAADLGAKSPIAQDTLAPESALFGPGLSDTIQIEVTSLLRFWQFDTTSATAVYLRLLALDRADSVNLDGSEGSTFTALRLYSSRTPAFRPSLRLTFVRRFKFGEP